MPTTVIRGQAFTCEAAFYASDNVTPFVATGPAVYNIFDHLGNLVLTGAGTQDNLAPAIWRVQTTLPSNVPIPTQNEKYRVNWQISNASERQQFNEQFSVVAEGDPAPQNDSFLGIEGSPFEDSLTSKEPFIDNKFSIKLINQANSIDLFNALNNVVVPQNINGLYRYNFNSIIVPPEFSTNNQGVWPFIVEWSYATATRPTVRDYHFLYLLTPRAIIHVQNLRMFIDKAQNQDINPNLQFTDVELLHFVYQGLARINASPPGGTAWSLQNIPEIMKYPLEKCAQHEALNAWYLAEGISNAFDFQGAAVQLTIDRTQFIQTKMDEINNWLESNLKESKRSAIRGSGRGGALSVSISPVLNMPRLPDSAAWQLAIAGSRNF